MDISKFLGRSYTAGDTWTWIVETPQYPASSGWSYTYAAKAVGQKAISWGSTAAGQGHKVTVPSSVTATMVAGDWVISVALIDPEGQKQTLGRKTVQVQADLAASSVAYDPRSHNQKCLDALRKVLLEGSDRDILEEAFKDYTVKYKSNRELLSLLQYYEIQVAFENGIKTGRIIENRV